MKKQRITKKAYLPFYVFIASFFVTCAQKSELAKNAENQWNGSFELSEKNLPANWLMYSPNTVPNSDFTISLDQSSFKEGKQSLKFEVISCSDVGGWKSPGFTRELIEQNVPEPTTYKISYWIKNKDATFQVKAGGVTPTKGNMQVLQKENSNFDVWSYFEFPVKVEKGQHFRVEFNILSPGRFWIDDVKLVKKEN